MAGGNIVMDKKEKYLLVIKYLNNKINNEGKNQFYNLLINDKEFKKIFIREYNFKGNLDLLEHKMPSQMKDKIYKNILKSSKKRGELNTNRITDLVVNRLYDLFMPRMAQGIYNITKEG